MHEIKPITRRARVSEHLNMISILARSSTTIMEDAFGVRYWVCDETEVLHCGRGGGDVCWCCCVDEDGISTVEEGKEDCGEGEKRFVFGEHFERYHDQGDE